MQKDGEKTFYEMFNKYKEQDKKIYDLFNNAKINNIKINKEQRKIHISLSFTEMVSFDIIDNTERVIKSVYELNHFKIISRFPSECFCTQNIGEIIKILKSEMPAVNGFLDNSSARLEEGILYLTVKYGGADILSSLGCEKALVKIIKEQFDTDIKAVLESEEYTPSPKTFEKQYYSQVLERENVIKKENQKKEELIKEKIITPDNIKKITQKIKNDKQDNILVLGKVIKSGISPIKECNADSGTVTVVGDVFNFVCKETKDRRKYIISFNLTDYTSSICIKIIGEKEKLETVIEKIKDGLTLLLRGRISFDTYEKDTVIFANDIMVTKKENKMDEAIKKRIELHAHTNMSSMDSVVSSEELIKRAAKWGHKAIAITDHGVAQAYPEAMLASQKYGIKVIYGVEGYFVNDTEPSVFGNLKTILDDEFIVFDIETTGLSPVNDRITEIGAVKVKNNEIIDTYCSFVNPHMKISEFIAKLTGITNDMVKDAPDEAEVIKEFFAFAGNSPLVAHNAQFDIGFLKQVAARQNLTFDYTYIDTIPLCRALLAGLKSYKLNIVAEHLNLNDFTHHRASDDAMVLANIIFKLFKKLKEEKEISNISQINSCLSSIEPKRMRANHIIILVKNYIGLKNLYKLISQSHLEYYYKQPKIPKSILMQHREGLIIGSACESGELFRAVVEEKPWEELCDIANFYDFLEIQPLGNNNFLINQNMVADIEKLKELNKTVLRLGEELKKPVVATGDVHFLEERDEVFRRILMSGLGYEDADNQAPLYFRTTEEMLNEFDYLETDKAVEIVIENPNKIADMCEDIRPIPKETFIPELPGSDEELQILTTNRAKEIYGEHLPKIVAKRMEKELNAIIKHGFSVMYMIAQKLVSKSIKDGYLVGSRGSVGSSFAAFLAGITEVNALCPHYICPNCKNSEFFTDGEYGSGVDMPDKICPNCGKKYIKDGFDIPFETFLGFDGDKAPDIDLNFSGEYQSTAHKYTEELFGSGYVFRAGTIGTIADKTAYGFIKKYTEEKGINFHKAEVDRLVKGCSGIKRTTGQHPGGVIIVPKTKDIYDFCPIQHPADDTESNIITTHFDYHSIHDNLLKLDILGHDDPTVIRMLEDLTGLDAREIPLDDPETMSIFMSNKVLNIEPDNMIGEIGTTAIPEFGTKFVRQILIDTKPKTFAELVRISGLSHGTDVWINNANDLVRNNIAGLTEIICTRDDIMLYLIKKGISAKESFNIMESIRKGAGLKKDWEKHLRENGIPEWYISSCKKIQYMFPKAHAVAYVMMAFRIAYYKVHFPLAFYAAYFTIRADAFDASIMINGPQKVKSKITEIEANKEATQKEKDMVTVLEVCYEMYKRGYKFCPIDIYKSDLKKFVITDDGLLPPLTSLQGVGESAAKSIIMAREKGKFLSIEEIRERSQVSKAVIEVFRNAGVFEGISESMQLALF